METITFFGLDTDRMATMLKAVGHPVRLEILQTLSAGGEDNCCVDFTRHASLAQSTVSQHLRVLKDAGLIKYCGDGPRSGWCIDRAAMVWLKQQVVALWARLLRAGPRSCPSRSRAAWPRRPLAPACSSSPVPAPPSS